MAYISDDRIAVTVEIENPGVATIVEGSIVAPTEVPEGEAFTIGVTVKNTGEDVATIYAQLLDAEQVLIEGTLQEKSLVADEEWAVVFNLPGQTVDTFVCSVDAGHKTAE